MEHTLNGHLQRGRRSITVSLIVLCLAIKANNKSGGLIFLASSVFLRDIYSLFNDESEHVWVFEIIYIPPVIVSPIFHSVTNKTR